MGLLFYLSSVPMEIKAPTFSAFDKLSHMVAYGILAVLIYFALREMDVGKRYLLLLAFVISSVYGLFNEIHQHFLPWRNADVFDAIANGIGAFLFPLVLRLREPKKP